MWAKVELRTEKLLTFFTSTWISAPWQWFLTDIFIFFTSRVSVTSTSWMVAFTTLENFTFSLCWFSYLWSNLTEVIFIFWTFFISKVCTTPGSTLSRLIASTRSGQELICILEICKERIIQNQHSAQSPAIQIMALLVWEGQCVSDTNNIISSSIFELFACHESFHVIGLDKTKDR